QTALQRQQQQHTHPVEHRGTSALHAERAVLRVPSARSLVSTVPLKKRAAPATVSVAGGTTRPTNRITPTVKVKHTDGCTHTVPYQPCIHTYEQTHTKNRTNHATNRVSNSHASP